MKAILSIFCLLFFSTLRAQEADSAAVIQPKEAVIFTVVEDPPLFPGGEKVMLEFVKNSINYPSYALENGIEGKVHVKFIVNEDGKISDAHVVGKNVDSLLATEALRIVNSMPTWKPGKQRGKAVKVYYVLPVRFVLNDHKKQ